MYMWHGARQLSSILLVELYVYKKLVILFMVPRHVSKIGTLILVRPQSVMLRCAAVTFT